jgi:hypothetical protein
MSEAAPEVIPPAGQNPQGTPNPPAPTTQNPATEPQGTEPDHKAEAEKLRAELQKFRRLEDQLKAMRPKAQKFDEMQQAVMTAEERAQAAVEAATSRASEAETRATTAERELAILRAGIENKLEKDDLVFLLGVPVDKIEEAAKNLAKRLGKADTPNFDGGPRTPPPATNDMNAFLGSAVKRAKGIR